MISATFVTGVSQVFKGCSYRNRGMLDLYAVGGRCSVWELQCMDMPVCGSLSVTVTGGFCAAYFYFGFFFLVSQSWRF